MDSWSLRAPKPPLLVRPVPIDPDGRYGPTRGQAPGPYWRRTSPGLYVGAQVDRGLPEQRILEESARLRGIGGVSGWAALRLHGAGYFDGIAPDGARMLPVPLVVPPGTALRAAPGIKVHRERLTASELALRHGVATTSVARATFDAIRWAADLRAGVIVVDMALASGAIAGPALTTYLETRGAWPGRQRAVHALTLSDARSMSPKETELRLIWTLDAGLPIPKSNWPVADADGAFIGRPDLLCEELAVIGEFDGADHRSRSRHRDDLRRDDRFRAVGLEPFRVVGADLSDVPLVLARIRAAITRASESGTPRAWRVQANPRPVA